MKKKHEHNNNNNNNGFKVRFGVRRRHRGPPFARGYHQFILVGGSPRRRGKEKVGTLVGSVVSMCLSGLIKRFMGGKDVFSRKKETSAELDRIVVQNGRK